MPESISPGNIKSKPHFILLLYTDPVLPDYKWRTSWPSCIPGRIWKLYYPADSTVQPGQLVTATATVIGCQFIFGFCFTTIRSTGAFLSVPIPSCPCRGLRVEVFSDVLPINPEDPQTTAATTITASVSNPAPTGGCKVTFEQPKPVAYSGGHDHDDSQRPNGTLDKTSCIIQEGTTFCTLKYTASEVSGEEVIEGKITSSGEKATGKVVIKVPGLVELGESGVGS